MPGKKLFRDERKQRGAVLRVMCLALMIATMSFYPGQAKLFSKALRATNLLFIPHVLLIGATIFWLYRISLRKRAQRARAAVEVPHKEALAA